MARNFVQPGDTVTVLAPYDVQPGDGLLVGALFAVALNAALSGKPVEARTRDVWRLKKNTGEAWTAWAKIYWDNTNKRCTTTATSNTLIGVCTQAAASADTSCPVKLGIVA